MLKLRKKHKFIDYLLIIIGTTLLATGINVYYEGLGIVTGGVTGLSIIIKYYTEGIWPGGIPLSISNLCINIPLFIIAFAIRGKEFGGKSLFATVYLSIALEYTKFLPQLNHDFFLAAVFGAIFSGIGIGMVFMAEASTGGTDLAGSVLHHFFPSLSMAKWMQSIDIVIILIGLFAFGPEKAMYAIISVYISVQIIDTLLEGLNFSKAAMIISDKNEEISQEIMKQLDRGVTGLKGVGKYTGLDKEVLLCVMSKREILTVKKIVKQVDVNAFMIVTDAREVFGEGFIEHPEMNKSKKLSKNN
ncbi:MAG: YitT family protein [Eubacteriales bacterium]|nr:YitT family protein [Eubacteriales bacterium]